MKSLYNSFFIKKAYYQSDQKIPGKGHISQYPSFCLLNYANLHFFFFKTRSRLNLLLWTFCTGIGRVSKADVNQWRFTPNIGLISEQQSFWFRDALFGFFFWLFKYCQWETRARLHTHIHTHTNKKWPSHRTHSSYRLVITWICTNSEAFANMNQL